MDDAKQLKEAIEFIELFGHCVCPLEEGHYFIRWVNCKCVKLDALELIGLAKEIREKENE